LLAHYSRQQDNKTKMPININRILICILVTLIFVYIRYYYTYPSYESVMVNQTNIVNFDFNQLLEKHPLVIHDQIVDARDLCNSWFKWNRCRTLPITELLNQPWLRNRYKYLLVHASNTYGGDVDAETEVFMAHPHHPMLGGEPAEESEHTLIGVQLKAHSVLIVPIHWNVHFPDPDKVTIIGVHDLLTWILP